MRQNSGGPPEHSPAGTDGRIPATLRHPGAATFWTAVILTGIGAGLSAAALITLLSAVQHLAWPPNLDLLDAATRTDPWRRVMILLGAGLLTGVGQMVLVKLTGGNGIEITTALWFSAGRLPVLRTMGSAVLSEAIVGLGASLGREGAPKQAGAAIANVLADRGGFSDEQRRLLVACGAGAGMAAAYDVPLGGALFAIEVLRGVLALRLVLPALAASVVAAMVSWVALPDAPTYIIPAYRSGSSIICWALIAGPIAGVVSVGFVRMIALADRARPKGWLRLVVPSFVLALLGAASIWFPQLLGNGKDLAQLTFNGEVAPPLLLALLLLKPIATAMCLGSGAPGGLFTPSLTLGALLGAVLGHLSTWLFPGVPSGLCALIGAGAVIAATTQGPISAVVLMIELTGHDRTFIAPLLVAAITATIVSRTIDSRSIYDARLTDEELAEREKLREPASI
ncbi:Voltage gated chloride channel family protein [Methylocella tundrae]|uniref:Voltage gated chloride channel family protein n=1 Tax=Methylocella tundrae TaxID=227605 RepID=A0A8B6M6W0_METTU|nr:chloride channel protein [Methylocella tundrae]VTZ50773.1 Voltage gated chloride channel family protein [Methylocella tundrae]